MRDSVFSIEHTANDNLKFERGSCFHRATLGTVLIRCRICGALYQTGISMSRKNYDTQARSLNILKVCPYCKATNSNGNAQLVFQGI